MAFTGAQYKLAECGIVPVMMARGARKRLLVIGDSWHTDSVTARMNSGWYSRSRPAGGLAGFFIMQAATGCPALTADVTMTGVTKSAIEWPKKAADGTTNTYYPNAATGVVPSLGSTYSYGATVVEDSETHLYSLSGGLAGTGANEFAAKINDCVSPRWWQDALTARFLWHEPKMAIHGATGPTMGFGAKRTTTGAAGAETGILTTVGTDSGNIRGYSLSLTAASAAVGNAGFPRFSVFLKDAAGFADKAYIPVGCLVESATATQGLSIITIGNSGYGQADYLNTDYATDACYSQFAEALGVPIDGIFIWLGANITGTDELTQLGAGTTTNYKANKKLLVQRLRDAFGNVPVCLGSPYFYGQSTTVYNTMVDALKETCDEASGVGLVNVYHNGGSPQAAIDASTSNNSVTQTPGSNRHPNENGSRYFVSLVWEQIHAADEARRTIYVARANASRARRV